MKSYLAILPALGLIAGCADIPSGPDPLPSEPSRAVIEGSGTWAAVEEMPAPQVGPAGAALSGLIYVAGGGTLAGRTAAVRRYDPATDTWTNSTSLPGPVNYGRLIALGGTLYFMGGSTDTGTTDEVWSWTPGDPVWTARAPLPVPLDNLMAATYGNRIYVFGGAGGDGRAVYRYNPTTDTWVPRAPMPIYRTHGLAVTIGDRIYLAGGSHNEDVFVEFELHAYDPVADEWERRADAPAVFSLAPMGGAVEGILYISGGGCESIVAAYDPGADEWTRVADVPQLIYYSAFATVGKRIYQFGGSNCPGYDPTANSYSFRPADAGNHAPTVVTGGPYAGSEGVAIAFDASASTDPDGDAIASWAWDFGDGDTASGATANHAYADNGEYTVELTVTDVHGLARTRTTRARVSNARPAVSFDLPLDTVVITGEGWLAAGGFADAGADEWTATVDYGDGSGAQALALTGMTFEVGMPYTSAGRRAIIVRVTDDDGGAGGVRGYVRVHAPRFFIIDLSEQIAALDPSVTRDQALASLLEAKRAVNRADDAAAVTHLDAFKASVDELITNAEIGASSGDAMKALADRLIAVLS